MRLFLSKTKPTLKLFIAFRRGFSCCFSLRGNANFLIKKFYNIDLWCKEHCDSLPINKPLSRESFLTLDDLKRQLKHGSLLGKGLTRLYPPGDVSPMKTKEFIGIAQGMVGIVEAYLRHTNKNIKTHLIGR